MNRAQEILLIRHAEVSACWKGICYGAMDVSLSDAGRAASDQLAEKLFHSCKPRVVYHSGLSRTRYLANQIAVLGEGKIAVHEDARLLERNYGLWQGLTWDAIYASDPDHFHDLIQKPDSYRPPEGETTSEMQRRMIDWLNDQQSNNYPIVVISHSGPIAAIVGYLQRRHATEWDSFMTRNLEVVYLQRYGKEYEPWRVDRRISPTV